MIVLGVDAGVTSGLAIVSGDDLRVLFHQACPLDDLPASLNLISPSVDEVVVERALPYKRSRLGAQLHQAHDYIAAAAPEATWIDASDWKTTDAKWAPVPRGLSTHERDAIRIARWFIGKYLVLTGASAT